MKWISDLIDLIFPRHCCVCGEILSRQERDICLNCLYTLPKIGAQHKKEIEQVFWGKVEIESAASFIYYRKGSPYNALMHKFKYKNAPEVGTRLAEMAAKEQELLQKEQEVQKAACMRGLHFFVIVILHCIEVDL